MKKLLKIAAIAVAVLLLVALLLPMAFSGKVKEEALREGNKMIDARFDFGKLSLSLFRNFPRVSASLHDFYIVGKDRFEGDTLLCAGRVTAAFDLSSLWKDSGYEISKVSLDNAMLNAIVLEDSTANWDIMRSTGEGTQVADTTASTMRLQIKDLTVNNLSLKYDDRPGGMYASVGRLDAAMSGDLGAARSTLRLRSDVSKIVFRMNGIPYLNGADFFADLDVDVDIENGKYTLGKSVLRLNAIEAGLNGHVEMLEDEGYGMDLQLSTPKIAFKEILSLVPAIYAKDFESVQATGDVSLTCRAKGVYRGEELPAFDLALNVGNGTFRYPSLPAGVEDINIALKVANPGGVADLTRVTLDQMRFSLGGNQFGIKASVATPVSNMAFDIKAKGKLDLGRIQDVYPLDSMELSGLVDADVTLAGTMADIENSRYENLDAQGVITLAGMTLEQAGGPDVNIERSSLLFSPRWLELSETSVTIGRNDLVFDARVENYVAWALRDEILKGSANMRSNYLNVSDFISEDTAPQSEEDTARMSVIEVPKNLDLAIEATLKQVIYDGLQIDDLNGNIIVNDGTADLRNLSMNTLGGSVVMNGSYSTARSVDNPDFAARLSMNGLSFSKTFSSFVTVQKLAPIFEGLTGNFSGSMELSTTLDATMSPVTETLGGSGSLTTKDLSLSQVAALNKIAELASIGGMMDNKVKDLKVDFSIEQGKVRTEPFDIRLGETLVNLSGTTSIDSSIDYTGKVTLPAAVAAVTRMSTANVRITGSFSSPQVSLDVKDMASQLLESAVQDLVGDKLGIDLSEAKAQKERLISQARSAGEAVMSTAREQADALVEKANNPLAKIAAKKAADAALSSAQKRVDDMVAKATARGDSIIAAAGN